MRPNIDPKFSVRRMSDDHCKQNWLSSKYVQKGDIRKFTIMGNLSLMIIYKQLMESKTTQFKIFIS